MELADGSKAVVDPEVQAYVSSLVTALGGSGSDEDGRYVLGDDALACLRDIKRWLKLYDEKANRLDVARCLAELNLVGGDLLQILAAWPENETDNKIKSRIALACVELLVPLTWPLDKGVEMTVNHHRHIPFLQLAQVGYKRSIVNYDGARILHTVTRVALPAMAVALKDRSTRDENVIRMVLYLLRNIAMIAPPPGVQYDGDEIEISRSAIIDAFDYQDILHLLLALCSSMGEDFNTQDVVVMEILFHLIKGVDIETLFMNEKQLDSHKDDELAKLLNQEAGMRRANARTAPTRHSRFGTMLWVKRDDGKVSTVTGQDALLNTARSLDKMDKNKTFKPPTRAPKEVKGPMDFDAPEKLSQRASNNLKTFVEDFLDSGFNPLFQNVRKAIDRQAERILEYHPRQFFYLVSWFLEAERVRRQSKKSQKSKKAADKDTDDSFGLVASVLNQEMFITLNRAMEKHFGDKSWDDLKASMKCFTQILLTVQEMSESKLDEDQEIAENILARIFYEETTHDRVANIIRTFKDQGFGYLDAATELAHVYIRILENYSKQNTDLQVRSRRRVRRKKKAAIDAGEDDADDEIIDGSDNDDAQAERVSRERKFDFKRFSSRFLTQGCIDTFVTLVSYYQELKPEQMKRAHRFLYRVAFKMDMSIMLFRVDIIRLLHKIIKGPGGLDPASKTYKEWDELVRHILRKCVKKIQEHPELIVEMLFSKTTYTANFFQYGYESQTIESKARAAAELEVKPGFEWEQQIGVVVGALLDRNEGHLLEWLKSQLSSAEIERRSWEGASEPIQSVETDAGETPPVPADPPKAPSIVAKPSDATCKTAMLKNGYLRLLMTLVGLRRIGDENDIDTPWVVPSHLSSAQLKEALTLIKAAEFDPPTFENGYNAEAQIRRVSAAQNRRRAAFDDESDNGIDEDDAEILFPAGGPTPMSKSDAFAALKKTRRKRRRSGTEDDALDEEQLAARDRARRAKDLEKQRKIKSELFVHDSDDESDAERDEAFFAEEERTRAKVRRGLLVAEAIGTAASGVEKKKPKVPVVAAVNENDSDEDAVVAVSPPSSGSQKRSVDVESGEEIETETPLSSPHTRPSGPKRARLDTEDVESKEGSTAAGGRDVGMVDLDDDDDEDIPAPRRPRGRAFGGFVVDSSDEE
ncbi:hypothetical protein V499_04420 [Pseudogymnoascus sp. VKM F-103]|uniref:Topoisomerase 1-associated factor 1 n=1 Tax=Pseudogymnoascus verrucosus TaxID=342668 RepID=A0A1B8GXH9_9PEZI|nr:DNA repair [Pseudogymnoascus verrucosus]KFY75618.1 hypothetical protein V499_04420 [Pseudogymnoascus sp. VKM F-103]OBU00545.1 DNA repair [Pseudogymnoascus verrucosus]